MSDQTADYSTQHEADRTVLGASPSACGQVMGASLQSRTNKHDIILALQPRKARFYYRQGTLY